MKRKSQELTLIFGSEHTGKAENVLEIIKNKKPDEKAYIIDCKGKYKKLLLEEQIAFNYHKLPNMGFCNPINFESYIHDLEGEDYVNEFHTHLEETIDLINSVSFSPLPKITTRKVLTKMYKLAGITDEGYTPIPHADKVLVQEMFYQILKEVDPELSQILTPLLGDLTSAVNSSDLRNILPADKAFDTSSDVILLDLDHYIHGEDWLNDLKTASIVLELRRRIRNEGKPILFIVDNIWPVGSSYLAPLYYVVDNMRIFYLNDEFSTFCAMHQKHSLSADELRFHRSGYNDLQTIAAYFCEPELSRHILSLPYKEYVSIKPIKDIGDRRFFNTQKESTIWKIDWNDKVKNRHSDK